MAASRRSPSAAITAASIRRRCLSHWRAYYDRTADLEFIRSIWKNIEAALNWIDKHGDIDGDGFVE
jgi:hypothetical protein